MNDLGGVRGIMSEVIMYALKHFSALCTSVPQKTKLTFNPSVIDAITSIACHLCNGELCAHNELERHCQK